MLKGFFKKIRIFTFYWIIFKSLKKYVEKIKTFDSQYVKTTFENKLVWNVWELILWKLGEIILPKILKPYLGLLKKTNKIKEPCTRRKTCIFD